MRTALALLVICLLAHGQELHCELGDWSDTARVALFGSAHSLAGTSDSVLLRLVEERSQAGAGFLKQRLPLRRRGEKLSFSCRVRFRIHGLRGSDGADGLALLLLPEMGLGGQGGGMGFFGLERGLAVEFDTWQNPEDADGNHVGFQRDGSMSSAVARPWPEPLNGGQLWTAWLDYDGTRALLELRLSSDERRPSEAALRYGVDLVEALGCDEAVVGFSAGTGDAVNLHDVYEIRWTCHPATAWELLDVPGR